MSSFQPGPTNRLLGYPPQARLLIIHADDFGMCAAVNEAVIRVLGAGSVCSTSLMLPCQAAGEAMAFLAVHPEVDSGVHLTAISDGEHNRWKPLTSCEKVPSLTDADGFFPTFDSMKDYLSQIDLDELEIEFRAQIEAALGAGLHPSHLDWHSLRIGMIPELGGVLFRLAREYGLALRVMGAEWRQEVQSRGLPCIDSDFLDSYLLDPSDKPAQFRRLIHDLPAGLNEWAVHPGVDGVELQWLEPGGSHFRQADLDYFSSPQAAADLRDEGIILLGPRSLQPFWKGT